MPWEPLRPWGLVSAEGIRVGPPPWLSAQLQGFRFCGGRGCGRARTRAEAGGQRLQGAGCGEGSTSGFLQRHCSPWKAFPASVKCGPLALCLAWPSPSDHRARPYLQALQRKTNDSLSVVDGVDSPCLSGQAKRRGAGDPGRLAVSVDACAQVRARCALSCPGCPLSLPKKSRK